MKIIFLAVVIVYAHLACAKNTPGPTTEVKARLAAGIKKTAAGDFKGAQEDFMAARRMNLKDAEPLFKLGELSERMGRLQEARAYFEECLKLNPKFQDCSRDLKKVR